MAEAASGVPQGSVLGPILFVIHVDDLTDNLTIDHLLYADDVKLFALRKQSDALQSSLLVSFQWSEGWELILNPSKIVPSVPDLARDLVPYWNILPEEIVNATSVETFKFRLEARWQSLFPEVPL